MHEKSFEHPASAGLKVESAQELTPSQTIALLQGKLSVTPVHEVYPEHTHSFGCSVELQSGRGPPSLAAAAVVVVVVVVAVTTNAK